ncbi:hypothetical protein GCM10028778_12890 [Barrientosiimonas marina]|uniref:STAS/SEC14 domain-containing protein n=1 Tax=Lentibacillus kimchii TaxID=1542911 RepID=A0ABW2USW4_9BACI
MIENANIEYSPNVDVTIQNKLTKEDVQKLDDFFKDQVADTEKINLLITTENWEGITLKGLLEDLKVMKHLTSINKAALVSDSKLMEADSKLDRLLPGVSLQFYTKDQKEDAKAWLSE